MNVILATPRVIQVRLRTLEPSKGKTETTIVANKADLKAFPPFGTAVALAAGESVTFIMSVVGGSGVVTIQSGEWPQGCGPAQQHLLGSTGKAESERIGIRYVEPNRKQAAPTKIAFTFSAGAVLDYTSANIGGRVDLGKIRNGPAPSTYYIALEVAPGAKGILTFEKVPKKGEELLKSIKV